MSAAVQLVDDQHHLAKLKATLQAKLALAGGYLLHELHDGTFLVSRWNYTKHCPSLREVAAFAQRVGAR